MSHCLIVSIRSISPKNIFPILKCHFNFHSFKGSLPNQLWKLTALKSLNMTNNFFTGSISTVVGNSLRLVDFLLSYNSLMGTLPAALSKLKYLSNLDVSGNLLSGTIPAWLGQLANLTYLLLSSNSFSKTIPSTVYSLSELIVFNVSTNSLSGNFNFNFMISY